MAAETPGKSFRIYWVGQRGRRAAAAGVPVSQLPAGLGPRGLQTLDERSPRQEGESPGGHPLLLTSGGCQGWGQASGKTKSVVAGGADRWRQRVSGEGSTVRGCRLRVRFRDLPGPHPS